MVQGQGVILKGAVKIRLAWMTGIAGFGEEGQIRQSEGCHQFLSMTYGRRRRTTPQVRMQKGQDEKNPTYPQDSQEKTRSTPRGPGRGERSYVHDLG